MHFFFLSVGISNKVKLYFCTENSKPGFDFLARNRSSRFTNFQSKCRELPTSMNIYANLLSLSTHMSNRPLLGKMYNTSAVNLINLPLLLSKKSLPAEQRIAKLNVFVTNTIK